MSVELELLTDIRDLLMELLEEVQAIRKLKKPLALSGITAFQPPNIRTTDAIATTGGKVTTEKGG